MTERGRQDASDGNVDLEMRRVGNLATGRTSEDHDRKIGVPLDVSGTIYILFDNSSRWRSRLAKETKAAGLPVDLNLL